MKSNKKNNIPNKMTTKRISIALLSIFVSVVAFAANKDLENDITMVSYEQSWLDSKATLALKNNSSEEVKNVLFLIIYLDMSDNELDYEEFTKRVSIAPGMTKKLDIPAYEHDRWYHYYKSEGARDKANTSFKIKFQLKDYNVKEEIVENGNQEGRYGSTNIIALLFISITIGLYVLVAVMAQKRNRNVVVWVLLSLFATPLLMIITLLVIGDNKNNI